MTTVKNVTTVKNRTAVSRARWLISGAAILGIFPYLILKVMWLSGSRLGLLDPTFGDGTTMAVLNAGTAFMDAVALVLALAFVTKWGQRLPASLVVFPTWIGTGLLGQILVVLPLQIAIGTDVQAAHSVESPLAAWVPTVVYSGFAWQGFFLILGFALYARDRWGHRQGWNEYLQPRRPSRSACAAAIGALVLGLVSVAQALGAERDALANPVGAAVIYVAAALGVIAVTSGRPTRVRRWIPVAAAWCGSGALFAWGVYSFVLEVVPNDLAAGWSGPSWEFAGVVARIVVGALCGMTVLSALRAPRTEMQRDGVRDEGVKVQ